MKNKLNCKYWQRLSLKNLKTGFTLTELIIVIVIIGIMPAIIMPCVWHHYYPRQEQAKIYHWD